jgi:hypothetical protein
MTTRADENSSHCTLCQVSLKGWLFNFVFYSFFKHSDILAELWHFCACTKPGTVFSKSYIMLFFVQSLEVRGDCIWGPSTLHSTNFGPILNVMNNEKLQKKKEVWSHLWQWFLRKRLTCNRYRWQQGQMKIAHIAPKMVANTW